MTTGQTTASLFRRRRRWPWIVLALLLVAGACTGAGLAVLDDDGRDRRSSAPAGTPAPTATPPSDTEPTETPEPAPSPEPSPLPTEEPLPDPTDAPSVSASPGGPTASPTRTASSTPPPTRTPGPSATSAGYPPPGMRLQVSTQHVGANRARIRIRVTDTDGTWNGGYVDFGDGTSRQFAQSNPSCSTPAPGPYQPAPSDRTVDVLHDYPAKGTYDVFVRVRTDRPCQGTPAEEASRVVSVTVDDATPGPTPTPILTPPAAA